MSERIVGQSSVHPPQECRGLPGGHPSLRTQPPQAAPGTIYALAVGGGIAMSAKEERVLLFGRNREAVHICVGEDDTKVSRKHGLLVCRGGRWWVWNLGKLPLRIADDRMLFADEEPVPLAPGFSALRVHGSNERQHVIEVHVSGGDQVPPRPLPDAVTEQPTRWHLDDDERLVLTVLGQRYLRQAPYPQPLSWRQAEEGLAELAPEKGWNAKHIERLVAAVRMRISAAGVPGLTREEVGEPVGNVVNHNLLAVLLQSTTLRPADLQLIDEQ